MRKQSTYLNSFRIVHRLDCALHYPVPQPNPLDGKLGRESVVVRVYKYVLLVGQYTLSIHQVGVYDAENNTLNWCSNDTCVRSRTLTCSPVPVVWIEEVWVESVRFRHGFELLTNVFHLSTTARSQ